MSFPWNQFAQTLAPSSDSGNFGWNQQSNLFSGSQTYAPSSQSAGQIGSSSFNNFGGFSQASQFNSSQNQGSFAPFPGFGSSSGFSQDKIQDQQGGFQGFQGFQSGFQDQQQGGFQGGFQNQQRFQDDFQNQQQQQNQQGFQGPQGGFQGRQGGFQGHPGQGFQGHPGQGFQGHPGQGFQGHPGQGFQGHPGQGFQGHPHALIHVHAFQGHPGQFPHGHPGNFQGHPGQGPHGNFQGEGFQSYAGSYSRGRPNQAINPPPSRFPAFGTPFSAQNQTGAEGVPTPDHPPLPQEFPREHTKPVVFIDTNHLSGYARAVVYAAAYAGVDVALCPIDMQSGQNKTEAYLKIAPTGQVPALRDGELYLFDSAAIIRYLSAKYKPSLEGRCAGQGEAHYGKTQSVIEYIRCNVFKPAMDTFSGIIHQKSSEAIAESAEKVVKGLEFCERYFFQQDPAYCIGTHLSTADILLAVAIKQLEACPGVIDLSPYVRVMHAAQAQAETRAFAKSHKTFNQWIDTHVVHDDPSACATQRCGASGADTSEAPTAELPTPVPPESKSAGSATKKRK